MVYIKLEILRWICIIKILTLNRTECLNMELETRLFKTMAHSEWFYKKKKWWGIRSFIHLFIFIQEKRGYKLIQEWRMILEGVRRALLRLDETLASLVSQTVKNLPSVQDTQVQSLAQKDPLEKGTATHSSNLPWKILWTEATVPGVAKSQTRLSD